MQRQRTAYRKKTYLAAFATAEGGRHGIFCMVRDLSAHGARLNLPDGEALPDTLDLEINGRPRRLRAKVVWRQDGEAGVRFMPVEAEQSRRAAG